ncbi:MAG: extracellular solute-binding protein [Clostridia bacterium]|nr:extracellular solute-binding protein [Clostridia bacterium]
MRKKSALALALAMTMSFGVVGMTACEGVGDGTAQTQTTQYTVTVSAAGGEGHLTGGGKYDKDTSALVTATPKAGYTFVCWMADGQTVAPENLTVAGNTYGYSFKVTKNIVLAAVFVATGGSGGGGVSTYTITATSEDTTKGTVTGGGTYNSGANVTLTATALTGYTFAGWYEGGTQVSTQNPYTFTATAAKTLQAKFTAQSSGGESGGDEDPETPTGSGGPGDIMLDPSTSATLTVVVDNSASEEGIILAAATEFNKTYPNVQIEVVMQSDAITYVKNEGADIVCCIGENVATYASENVLMPLDDYMLESGFDTTAYYKSMMDMGKDPTDPEGKQYMLPRDYSRIICYYNKAIFDAAGVAYPQEGWTWDDYLSTCAALKAKGRDAVKITQAPMDYDILNWAVVSSFGVSNILDAYGIPIANTDAQYTGWKQGMEMARSVISQGYALSSQNYTANAFELGYAAMAFNTTAGTSQFVKTSNLDFDVVSFPAIGDTPKVATGAVGYGIAANSDSKAAAWAFLQFLMTSDGQAAIASASKCIPALKSLANDPTAAWRDITNSVGNKVTTANMISYTERDVTASWFGTLPASKRQGFKTIYASFLSQVVYNGDSFVAAYNTFKANAADMLN